MNAKLSGMRGAAGGVLGLVLLSSVLAASVSAAPTLTGGSASGAAGTTVTLPIMFNPTTNSVSSLQFNLTLPAGLSTGTVTAGAILTAASKSVSANLSGNTWTFIVFGMNQTAISSGTLLTAQLAISAGTAPGTLSVPVSGAVYSDPSGNPVAAGTSTSGSVTVTSSMPSAPVITGALTATGQVGTAFSYQITASNSPTSFGASSLPAGLSINAATGLISGTPSAAGTSNVTISATNLGGTGSATLALTVNAQAPAAPVIASTGAATGQVGTAFSYQITASNSPTSFGASGLPAGLSINTATGLISGTPSAAGTSNVTISATNSGGTGTRTLSLTINPQAVPGTAPTLSGGSVSGAAGTTVSFPVTFNPGSSSVSSLQFNLTLPAGLSTGTVTAGAILTSASKSVTANVSGNTWTFVIFGLNQNLIVGGTLLTAQITIAPSIPAGTLNLAITNAVYSDPNSQMIAAGANTAGTLTVTAPPIPAPVITSGLNATAQAGAAFSYQITAANSPTSFSATGLPAGLSIDAATGLISGTPAAAGSASVTISATNAMGTGSATLVLTINPASANNANDSASDRTFLSPGVNDVAKFGLAAQEITIFSLSGHQVFSGSQASPSSPVTWNGRDSAGRTVNSGVYIVRIRRTDGRVVYQRLVIVK